MVKKVVDTLLPTTMVGSYPRPHWFKQQLLGRDIRVAFKEVQHEEAYNDAVATVIRDQEEAGLDIVTDGNMWYDDYVGSIGVVLLVHVRAYPRLRAGARAAPVVPQRRTPSFSKAMFDDWGGVINSGPVSRGPIRYADLYKIAAKHAKVPVKVSVGAGPVNLAWHAYFKHYKDAKELSYALAPIFNAEMKELVAAGAKYLQIEDLGAWLPLFTGNKDDYKWIKDVIEQCCDGVDAKIGWHFCFGNAWGNESDQRQRSLRAIRRCCRTSSIPTGINEFVLDYANRNMAGVEFLKNLPKDKSRAGRCARRPDQCDRVAADDRRRASGKSSPRCRRIR